MPPDAASLRGAQACFRRLRHDDRAAVDDVVRDAFAPEDVVSFLAALRADGCLLGEWVAVDGEVVVGHIAWSRCHLLTPAGSQREDGDWRNATMLSPLSVRPDHQGRGIGLALTHATVAALEQAGERVFAVLGHPDFYPRAGFSAHAARTIISPWQGSPAFMVRSATPVTGTLVLPKAIVATTPE